MKSIKKSKGVTRRIDSLGRLTLVKEYRDVLDINEEDDIEQVLTENEIIIRKLQKGCVVCNSKIETNDFIEINKKIICKQCLLKLQSIEKIFSGVVKYESNR